MTTKTYDGQTARFLASVATCMPPLPGDVMQGWIDNPQGLKKALSGLNPPAVESKKKQVLKFHEDVSVGPLTERFVPNEFFKTRPGLYLYNDMQRVLRNAQVAEPTGDEVMRSFDLTKNAYDREIKAELSEHHEVELWQIAELIEAQKTGNDGPLLTNGYANIFYVAGYAVDVRWSVGDREWRVDGWGLDDGSWCEGHRVFSRN